MNKKKLSFNLAELAKLTACQLVGDPSYIIENVADLETATASDASFLANPQYLQAMKDSKAGVIFVDLKASQFENKNYLVWHSRF